uniref:Immunomodulatory protein n=1 Tax=Anoectochilus formosanus TaxID=173437 RepID=E2IQH4_9ASPA|nr:immunomodulatory protein [Anoectochilus formosanus]
MASSIRILILCAAALAFLLATPSYAASSLGTGGTLRNNQGISQGAYLFIMQSDCNLVLYDTNRAIWASNTNGRGNSCFLILQRDGNLVIYNNGNQVIWASGSNIGNGNYILVLQADRNVVIYTQPGNRAIWATGTNIRGTPGVTIYKPQNVTTTVNGK